MKGFEAMLCCVCRERSCQLGEEKSFEHFRCWAEKGYRTVGATLVFWFACFWEWYDIG